MHKQTTVEVSLPLAFLTTYKEFIKLMSKDKSFKRIMKDKFTSDERSGRQTSSMIRYAMVCYIKNTKLKQLEKEILEAKSS